MNIFSINETGLCIQRTIIISLIILLANGCGGGTASITLGSTPSSSICNTSPTKLNDTGITKCADYAYTDTGTSYNISGSGTHSNTLVCSTQATVPTQTTDGYDSNGDIIRAGQDALCGRDATNNDDSDGHAGFSFTKLDSSGNALVASASSWSCVKDNVTGLVWEVKTDSGLQNKLSTYTWYNSTNTNDGGDHGIGDTGTGTTTGYEFTAGTKAGSDNCFNNGRCDTEKYIADVNASSGLCGSTDWRLPSKSELISIVDNSKTSFVADLNYFPNTQNAEYWSSSPYAASIGAWIVGFKYGVIQAKSKEFTYHIRLVRGG